MYQRQVNFFERGTEFVLLISIQIHKIFNILRNFRVMAFFYTRVKKILEQLSRTRFEFRALFFGAT